MKRITFLSTLIILLSVLQSCGLTRMTYPQNNKNDQEESPLYAYKYFIVPDSDSFTISDVKQSGGGMALGIPGIAIGDGNKRTKATTENLSISEMIKGQLMSRGLLRGDIFDSIPEKTLLVIYSKLNSTGKRQEVIIQYYDAITKEIILTQTGDYNGFDITKERALEEAIKECIKYSFEKYTPNKNRNQKEY